MQPYPGPGPTVPISIGGGASVTWSDDGSELFYQRGTAMMAVSVTAAGTAGTPTELFDDNYVEGPTNVRQYHVAPDGRFLMQREASTPDPLPTQIILVDNWFKELKRLVPIP